MKFRVVLKTKTKKGKDLVLKLKIPPSKHQGLINFLQIATNDENPNNDTTFTIEKIGVDKQHIESSFFGEFKFKKSEPEKKGKTK